MYFNEIETLLVGNGELLNLYHNDPLFHKYVAYAIESQMPKEEALILILLQGYKEKILTQARFEEYLKANLKIMVDWNNIDELLKIIDNNISLKVLTEEEITFIKDTKKSQKEPLYDYK